MVSDLLLNDDCMQWTYAEERLNESKPVLVNNTVMGDLHSAEWWREACTLAKTRGCQLLCIILYTDGIVVDWAGKISLTPIMMTLGNFDSTTRRSLKGKRLLGFVPQLSVDDCFRLFPDGKMDTGALHRDIVHRCIGRFIQ